MIAIGTNMQYKNRLCSLKSLIIHEIQKKKVYAEIRLAVGTEPQKPKGVKA